MKVVYGSHVFNCDLKRSLKYMILTVFLTARVTYFKPRFYTAPTSQRSWFESRSRPRFSKVPKTFGARGAIRSFSGGFSGLSRNGPQGWIFQAFLVTPLVALKKCEDHTLKPAIGFGSTNLRDIRIWTSVYRKAKNEIQSTAGDTFDKWKQVLAS